MPRWEVLGLGPRRLSGLTTGRRVPIGYALAGVTEPGGCREQQTPIRCAPHVLGAKALFGLVPDTIFAWDKGNERASGVLLPFTGQRTGKGGFDRVVAEVREGLQANSIHPMLAAELLQQLRLTCIQNHRRVGALSKSSVADFLPAGGLCGLIPPIKGQQPCDRIRAPTSDDVADEQDGLVVGQGRGGVRYRGRFAEWDNRAKEARAAQRLQFWLKALEEAGVHRDRVLAGESRFSFRVLTGRDSPLRHGELLRRTGARIELPILRV